MTGVTKQGSWLGVGLVSFLAVYREVFETVLFYEALWVQSDAAAKSAILAGLGTGVAALVVLSWLIIRFSVRLPLGIFFGASSALLAAMAVIFAGQGIAALQAAGKLPASAINFPTVPLLGIYPNMQGVALQIVLLATIVGGWLYMRGQDRRVLTRSAPTKNIFNQLLVRMHALEYAILVDQQVLQGSRNMYHHQCHEHVGRDLVDLLNAIAQGLVLLEERPDRK